MVNAAAMFFIIGHWPWILVFGGLYFAFRLTVVIAENSDAERTGRESIGVRYAIIGIYACLTIAGYGASYWAESEYQVSKIMIEMTIDGNEKLQDQYKKYLDGLTK